MASPSLKLPVIQNWSCHHCGGCCREHLIEITEEERTRIQKQNWKLSDGINMDRPVIRKIAPGRYRLAHQADGACVFLDEQGLCRIHARFGEAAKPLACRVYPYACHPAGGRLAVSLRFSCPSVVQNLGLAVSTQQPDLQRMASEIVAGKNTDVPAPLIHSGTQHGDQAVDWPDFHRILNAFDDALASDNVHFAVRLMRILSWLDIVAQAQFQTTRGKKLDAFLKLITDASIKAQPDNELPEHRPGRLGRIMFRLMTAQYARHDTEAQVQAGIRLRLKLLSAALKFTTGIGRVPELPGSASVATVFHDEQATTDGAVQAARFGDIEFAFNGRRPDIDDLFTRYFRVKIQGLHFCGPGHYNTTLVDGFHGLALMYPIVMWLAKVRAVRSGRRELLLTDVQAALATADHNYGYSPALGTASALNRVSLLARMQQISALVGWYSR
ncbi:MAG: YkgJ family cysteine cluster protein [Planctomycetaceae bacterium]